MAKQLSLADFRKCNPMSNHYIAHAEEMWEELEQVHKGKIAFKSFHMALLSNMYEMYCKGLLELKLQDSEAHYRLHPEKQKEIFNLHNLFELTKELNYNGFVDLLPNDKVKRVECKEILKELTRSYKDSRYEEFYKQSQFEDCFDYIEIARHLILEEVNKYKTNPFEDISFDKEYEDEDEYEKE